MRDKLSTSMVVISALIFLALFSCATTHNEQIESIIWSSNKAIESNPNNPMAYNNRGSAYMIMGKRDLAISDYTKALEIDPKYAEAYFSRGMAFCIMRQYDKAISDLDNAVEIDPRHARAYNERGIAYYETGQYDQALSDFNKAIEINPVLGQGYYNRGRFYYFRKEYDKSWEDLKKAQELGREVPPFILNKLRRALEKQDRGIGQTRFLDGGQPRVCDDHFLK